MQPAKVCATSKKAPLESVTCTALAKRSAGISRPSWYFRSSLYSSTALRVQTDQWPSKPPTNRFSTTFPSTQKRKGVSRSTTILSSFPVYRATCSDRWEVATPRTRSMVWYRLKLAHFMATTPSTSATARQYSAESLLPPQACCR